MAKPSEAIKAFMDKFGVASDEIWPVPGGKTYAIMHKALQRIAREQGIVITVNVVEQLSNLEQGFAVVKAFGKLGDGFVESYGEASPKNNRNQYPLAMAQKRAEDRVILGLLSVYGDVYSEEEADDFKRQNPHVTRATDIHDEFSADIPDVPATKMKVKDARPEFAVLIKEMERIQDAGELREWGEACAERINSLPGEWPQIFRGEYTKHKKSISNGKAA
jgi:hypothetical protein